MFHYIKNRLYQLIPILLGITLLCFAIMYTATGDAIDVMEANQGVVYTEATKAQMRSELGLDKPFIIQYGLWLKIFYLVIWVILLYLVNLYFPPL